MLRTDCAQCGRTAMSTTVYVVVQQGRKRRARAMRICNWCNDLLDAYLDGGSSRVYELPEGRQIRLPTALSG